MDIKVKTISVSHTAIETGLWHIQRTIMLKYGTDQSYRDIAPLSWYINSGRASLDFIRAVMTAMPYMIGRKLHEGGSYDEVISRIKKYLADKGLLTSAEDSGSY